ncbi:MAG: cell division protein SepF [Chroococcidiopsidaceae cyanobacterium CP_BM_ER_R8_30]|nr:cell division protein SepF [Chroococcidiopsidaceae cyanobacterium CP_BM_ER_R8_30]
MKYEYEDEDEKVYQNLYHSEMPQLTTNVNPIMEVVIMKPRGFEEIPQVIQLLWKRKSVLLNLKMMNPYDAQRAVDFVAGGTYAIDGHQERVGEMIFLFTPICVQVKSSKRAECIGQVSV